MLRSPRALTGTACFYLLDLTQRLSLLRLISIRPDDLMRHDNFKTLSDLASYRYLKD